MGTRTNFYKNPSSAYNKQLNLDSVLQNLKCYNIATGNAPPDEPAIVVQRKRRRESRPPPDRRSVVKESDGPMSHQEYIEKRRKEADSSHPYQELTSDVLENRSSALNLVGYESDKSTSAECEEDPVPSNNLEEQLSSSSSGNGMQYFPLSASIAEDRIKTRNEQRYPAPGEPACVMCGKYGEYICNETDDDICSTDCKAELLQKTELQQSRKVRDSLLDPSLHVDVRWKCLNLVGTFGIMNGIAGPRRDLGFALMNGWKCQKPGHLAEDCLVSTSLSELSPAGKAYKTLSVVPNKPNTISRDLTDLYKRCHQIGKNYLSAKCNMCRGSTTLAACISCDNTFCDCAGHLGEHIRQHPTHQQYYSYKLKRLVKCCKSTCKVTRIENLLACHYCFDKAFDKFYDMYTATWKTSGLSIIRNSICCEDHFEWHRMNCLSADVEDNAYILKKKHTRNENFLQLSDFIF
ncbi:hypothetical protein CASFOL_010513 [Castilleja foliolosa]|uniref:Uncharacterized protein n=1 Tax=Castilleja foliolosa TaxID=1961234 RepID=A0ABD3DTB9_9LAMI